MPRMPKDNDIMLISCYLNVLRNKETHMQLTDSRGIPICFVISHLFYVKQPAR